MRTKEELHEHRVSEVARLRAKHDEAKKELDTAIMLALRDSVPHQRLASAAGISAASVYSRYVRRKPR